MCSKLKEVNFVKDVKTGMFKSDIRELGWNNQVKDDMEDVIEFNP